MALREQEQTMSAEQTLPLLLASSSPRRREILGRTGVPFHIVAADLDEDAFAASFEGSYPELVEALAVAKARAVAASQPDFDGLILAADTTVILDGDMLSKPRDPAEAVRMLRLLRGRAHQVATGVAVYDRQKDVLESAHLTTDVWMRPYSDEEIARYVATGDPLDKAGAYAVQHELFRPVERVEGCYLSVVGLPLCLVNRLLRRHGLTLAPLIASAPEQHHECAWSAACRPPLPPGAKM
jgi:septum formation protein